MVQIGRPISRTGSSIETFSCIAIRTLSALGLSLVRRGNSNNNNSSFQTSIIKSAKCFTKNKNKNKMKGEGERRQKNKYMFLSDFAQIHQYILARSCHDTRSSTELAGSRITTAHVSCNFGTIQAGHLGLVKYVDSSSVCALTVF